MTRNPAPEGNASETEETPGKLPAEEAGPRVSQGFWHDALRFLPRALAGLLCLVLLFGGLALLFSLLPKKPPPVPARATTRVLPGGWAEVSVRRGSEGCTETVSLPAVAYYRPATASETVAAYAGRIPSLADAERHPPEGAALAAGTLCFSGGPIVLATPYSEFDTLVKGFRGSAVLDGTTRTGKDTAR